ncbi:c-type cytochrome, partial [Sulfitobacter sp. HI0023]|uniref:c-type cytochrome n=5 Tax=unclassified Sulfitobacter TaxID=196795 RepID=UPI000AFF5C19
MNRAALISGLGLAGLVVAGTIIWSISDDKGVAAMEEIAGDVALGKAIYDDYCAACHGANLEGQPDW